MTKQDTKTLGFDEDGVWAPPVETRKDLWPFAVEGQLCFVKAEARTYRRRGAEWVLARI
ncbi:MAG: hypothetical protein KC656_06240 [Myxococcales bacterium]|nr:hypothetical protein [Myxococcales bacterium]